MAAVMGMGAPTGGSIIEQMTAVFDQLPHAIWSSFVDIFVDNCELDMDSA
jgi:hypothetical protein